MFICWSSFLKFHFIQIRSLEENLAAALTTASQTQSLLSVVQEQRMVLQKDNEELRRDLDGMYRQSMRGVTHAAIVNSSKLPYS